MVSSPEIVPTTSDQLLSPLMDALGRAPEMDAVDLFIGSEGPLGVVTESGKPSAAPAR